MNAYTRLTHAIAQPQPTAAGLVVRAIHAHDALTRIVYGVHMQPETALTIAMRAVSDAVADWAYDNAAPESAATADVRNAAARMVFDQAWEARERMQLADIGKDEAAMGRTWTRAQYRSVA